MSWNFFLYFFDTFSMSIFILKVKKFGIVKSKKIGKIWKNSLKISYIYLYFEI